MIKFKIKETGQNTNLPRLNHEQNRKSKQNISKKAKSNVKHIKNKR